MQNTSSGCKSDQKKGFFAFSDIQHSSSPVFQLFTVSLWHGWHGLHSSRGWEQKFLALWSLITIICIEGSKVELGFWGEMTEERQNVLVRVSGQHRKKCFWCSLSWNSESCINKRGPASENKQLALYSVSEWLTGTRSNCFLKEKDGF